MYLQYNVIDGEETNKLNSIFCVKFLKSVMLNTCVVSQILLNILRTLCLKLPRTTEKSEAKCWFESYRGYKRHARSWHTPTRMCADALPV